MSNNSKKISVCFYGVRGSHPVPGTASCAAGSNTACLLVRAGGQEIIFDCGSGLINLGRKLLERKGAGQKEFPVFLTHFHYDHIQGLPFFAPLYSKDFKLKFFGPDCAGQKFSALLKSIMKAPLFPVSMKETASGKTFRSISQGSQVFFDGRRVRVRAYGAKHPQSGALVYSVCCQGRKIVFATDIELGLQNEKEYIDFISGADILIHDAQYSERRYSSKSSPRKGWGHSTVEMACRAATLSKAKKLVLFHHDPMDGKKELDEKLKTARKLFDGKVEIAREGREISV